jgi:energy-coupling factor transport system ATP-binding protein
VIRFDEVSFRYDEQADWVLRDVELEVQEGELVLVIGATGVGKSTLLKTINGLVPHFSGGQMSGDVLVEGRSIRVRGPAEMADLVGYVGQDPSASFVTERVEDELAYAMENLGLDPVTMRRRVEDALDVMSLHELRDRPLIELSGGQRQRVAIAAVLAAAPRILVLDEPTSALDPGSAEEVLSALTRLVHDVGLTVVVAEHRLERVLPFADRVILMRGDGRIDCGPPEEIMASSPIAPPLLELGRLAGWEPLPMSVRDARRRADELRQLLKESSLPTPVPLSGELVASTELLGVQFGRLRALHRVSLELRAGAIYAVLGRNGSGKTTLLNTLAGMIPPSRGSVSLRGKEPAQIGAQERIRLVGLVPQEPGELLYAQRVSEECSMADHEHHLPLGSTATAVRRIVGELDGQRHPRDLSEGQRLSVAIGVVVAAVPALLLLDEPTRGLDYGAKQALVHELRRLRDEGVCVVVATHDVEFVASVADQALVLSQGELIASGPAREVVCHTPVFAPQVAKVLSPMIWLTVEELRGALEGR